MKAKPLLTRLLALAVSIAACLIVLEAAARWLFPSPRQFYIWPPKMEETFLPDQEILPGTSRRAWFRTNSLGLRGYEPAPNDDYRILVLGGSAAECLYLNERESWPRRLQARLQIAVPDFRVWVGNGGRSGQGSRDHVFHLEYLPLDRFDLDAVVVLIGVNDFILRLRQDTLYNPDFLETSGGREVQIDHAFLMVPASYSIPPPPFYRRAGLWQAAKRLRNRLFPPEPQDPRGEVVKKWREMRSSAGEFRDRLPDLEEAFGEYLDNLERMIQLARRRELRLIFVTQPSLWKQEMSPAEEAALWMGGVGEFRLLPGQPYYSSSALERGLRAYNSLLSEYCRRRGVECLDLAVDYPRDLTHFYDDCHFTVAGAEETARRLAAYLLSRPPWGRGS